MGPPRSRHLYRRSPQDSKPVFAGIAARIVGARGVWRPRFSSHSLFRNRAAFCRLFKMTSRTQYSLSGETQGHGQGR